MSQASVSMKHFKVTSQHRSEQFTMKWRSKYIQCQKKKKNKENASYFILGKGEVVLGEIFQANLTEIKLN